MDRPGCAPCDLALWVRSTPNRDLVRELRTLQREGLLPAASAGDGSSRRRRRAADRAEAAAAARSRESGWTTPGRDASYASYDCRTDKYMNPEYRHQFCGTIQKRVATERRRVMWNNLRRRRKLDRWRERAKNDFDKRRLEMELEQAEARGAASTAPENGPTKLVTLTAWLHSDKLRASVLAAEEKAFVERGQGAPADD